MTSLNERIDAMARLIANGSTATAYTSAALAADAKACEVCGAPFERPGSQSRAKFAKRRFCSQRCKGAAMHNTAVTEPTTCTCDTPRPDGIGECAGCHRLVLSHSWHEGRPKHREGAA